MTEEVFSELAKTAIEQSGVERRLASVSNNGAEWAVRLQTTDGEPAEEIRVDATDSMYHDAIIATLVQEIGKQIPAS